MVYLLSLGNGALQIISLCLTVSGLQLQSFPALPLFISHQAVQHTARAVHLILHGLWQRLPTFAANGQKRLDGEGERLLVDVLPPETLPEYRAGPRVYLLFKLRVAALHYLHPAARLGLIGNCLPFEALGFEQALQ